MHRFKGRTIAWAITLVLIALGLRWHWLTASLRDQASGILPDDAFYYFEIARRFAAGQGITFDGTTPATGLHLGWLFLISPLFVHADPGSAWPVRLTLTLSSLLAAFAALAAGRLSWRISGSFALGLLTSLVVSTSAWFIHQTINGLETALVSSVILVCLLHLFSQIEQPSRTGAVRLAAWTLLALFCRSDSLVFLAPAYSLLLLRRDRLRENATIVAVVGLGVLGLSLWNFLHTGSWLQSSANAIPAVFKQNWQRFHPDESLRQHSLGQFLVICRDTWHALGITSILVAAGCTICLFGAVILGLQKPRRQALFPLCGLWILLGVGLFALHFVHGYVRWLPRPWYCVSAVYVLALAPAFAYRAVSSLISESQVPAWGGRLFAVSLSVWPIHEFHLSCVEYSVPAYVWQAEMYDAGVAIDHDLPPGLVGSFNAGIIGYMATRPVINLDGVVNEAAARARREDHFYDYLRARGVAYLVDSPAMWDDPLFLDGARPQWGHPFTEPRLIHAYDVSGVGWPHAADSVEAVELR